MILVHRSSLLWQEDLIAMAVQTWLHPAMAGGSYHRGSTDVITPRINVLSAKIYRNVWPIKHQWGVSGSDLVVDWFYGSHSNGWDTHYSCLVMYHFHAMIRAQFDLHKLPIQWCNIIKCVCNWLIKANAATLMSATYVYVQYFHLCSCWFDSGTQ